MNLAQFLINGTPASPGGYDAETNEELVFTLAPGLAALCNRWTLAVYDPADSESPLASLDAPPLTLTGATTGLKVDASTPSANITATAPASGVHSWIVRSTVDGGLNPATGKLDPNRVFERMVVLRTAGGRRKIVPTEGSQYSPRGWADAQNEDVEAGGGLIQLHDLTHAPVALWQLQESLNDVSGNAFDLELLAGDQRFTEMLPGVAALNLFTNNKYRHNVAGTLLEIRGDLTIEMFVRLRGLTSGAILSYDTNTENESGNFLYSVGLTAAPTQTQFASEHGAGVDDAHSIPLLLPVGQPVHFAVRRQSDVIQFFLNGKPWGPPSAALTTPTGGDDSVFYLGWANNQTVECDVASIKICASALSNAQVLAEYNRTLGPFYGIRT